MNTVERKLAPIDALELKFDGEGRFEGYASMFNGVDAYGDTIIPGAYKKTIKRKAGDRPIRMRWNHFGPVIGKWADMGEDEKGLYVKGELTPGHSVAKDVYASMKHGAVSGMSIGYIARSAREKADGGRELKEIDLIEISVVEDPADLGARITGMKAVINELGSFKEIEGWLRDAAGLSRDDATALVSRVKSLSHRDDVPEPLDTSNQTAELIARLTLHSHIIKTR
jgi:HK97 family phage prohead protease